MGFFKKLFGLKDTTITNVNSVQSSVYVRSGHNLSEPDLSKPLESQGYTPIHSTRKEVTTPCRASYCPEELDFQDEHEKEINQWNRKIDSAEPSHNGNPDKIVSGYEKAIALCDEFKVFCDSFGYGGSTYYENNESYRKDELESLLDDYLSNDYDSDKAYFEEKKQAAKLFSSTKGKILKYVTTFPAGVMRKAIYEQFPPEQQPTVLKALNALINDGKILKEKQGDKLIFKSSAN